MVVYFWNFTKKTNSTGQPPLSTPNYTFSNVVIKAPTNVLKPILEISDLYDWETGRRFTYLNYAYIPDFRRYYFVQNWHFVNAKLIVDLEVDVLATYKADIEASSQFVLRSASHYDGNITDTKYPIKAIAPQITAGYYANNPLLPASGADGCVVVGIVNKAGSITGCVSYYVMGIYAFSELCTSLFTLSTQWGQSGADIADGLKKAITDPFQYFVSAIWLPYSVLDFTNRNVAVQTGAVFVGYDTITLTNQAYQFRDQIAISFTNLIMLPIPYHPQESARGNYMNFAPYSRYYFSFYPFAAYAELDAASFGGTSNLYCLYTVDLRTGKGVCTICKDWSGSDSTYYTDAQPSQIVRAFEAQIGVNIPISTIHTALPQSIADVKLMAVTGAASAVQKSGGFPETLKKLLATSTAGVAALFGASEETTQAAYDMIGAQPFTIGDASDIAEGAFAAKTTCEMSGSQGTLSFNYHMPIAFWGEFVNATDDALALFGRPLCKYRRLVSADGLDALTGFICCDKPVIAAPSGAYLSEVAEIENYLTTGLYLE